MNKAYNAFEKCLSEGVKQSKGSCLRLLNSVLHPVSTAIYEYFKT